jgi:tRNA pseudouridine38-40 synthase
MLKVGRGKMSIEELNDVIKARDCKLASFAVPAQGLFLVSVEYPADRFIP